MSGKRRVGGGPLPALHLVMEGHFHPRNNLHKSVSIISHFIRSFVSKLMDCIYRFTMHSICAWKAYPARHG